MILQTKMATFSLLLCLAVSAPAAAKGDKHGDDERHEPRPPAHPHHASSRHGGSPRDCCEEVKRLRSEIDRLKRELRECKR